MKSSITDTLAAPAWARPSARHPRPISLALRALMLALLAVLSACTLLAPRVGAASNPTIYSFKGGTTDGLNSEAPPVEDLSGNLWGTTYSGGAYGYGTVWEILKQSQTIPAPPYPTGATVKETIYSFTGGNDGGNPIGGLMLAADGNLYGDTYNAGANGYGVFFQVNPTTKAVAAKYAVSAAFAEPDNPSGTPVQDSSGNFYFPCLNYGNYDLGGIIKVSGSTFAEVANYSFGKYLGSSGATSDGAYPIGPLCIGRDGNIYGTTSDSAYGVENFVTAYGTVFKLIPALTTSSTPTIHYFTGGAGGTYPTSGLIQGIGADNNLYGTTVTGGANITGDIFSVTTTGTFTQLYAFPATPSATNPAYPQGTLTISADGTTLFGTTSSGGGSGYLKSGSTTYYGGNVFQFVISTLAYTNLWGFTGNTAGSSTDSLNSYNTKDTSYNGYFYPYNALFTTSGLVLSPDGYIYGTSLYSGTANAGTVFRVGPPQTYNYTYFVTGASATLSLAIDDFMATTTDTYTINAPSHGTVAAPLTGSLSITSTPATLSRTYTITGGYVGVDTFTYTGTDVTFPKLGTSKTGAAAFGNVTLYDGTITDSASPTTVTGTTTTLAAAGTLPTSSDTTLTYTWSAVGAAGGTATFSANGTNAAKSGVTATFSKADTYTVTLKVTAPDGTVYSPSNLTVTVTPTVGPFTLTYSPNPVGVGNTSTPTSNAKDQYGNTVAPTFTVVNSGGAASTINAATGVLTAGASTGSATVTATAGTQTANATVIITTPTAAVSTAASANNVSPTLPASGTFTASTVTLRVTGSYGGAGGNGAITYTWSNTGPSGVTYSANGSNAASTSVVTFTQAGTYVFTATLTAPTGGPATSQVTVVVTAAAASVSITPLGTASTLAAGVLVELGTTQQFTAVVKDQFGNTISSPTISWGVEYATVTQTGLYTATVSAGVGADYVTATSNGITATSYIDVLNDAPTIVTAAAANPNPVTGTTTQLTVTAQLRINGSTTNLSPESNLIYTWSEQASDPYYATVSGNGTNAAKTLTATFTHAGTYNVYVTVKTLGGATTRSPSSGYLTITVTQTLTSLAITPASGTSISPGGTQQFTVTGKDQFGVSMTAPTPSWSVVNSGGAATTINSSTGLMTVGASTGTATVTVMAGSYTASGTYPIQAASPVITQVAEVSGFDQGQYYTGTDDDTDGDTAADLYAKATYNGSFTYAWTYTGPSGVTFDSTYTAATYDPTVYFTQSGTYVFKCTITGADGVAVTTSVTIIIEAEGTTINIVPVGPLYVGKGTTQQFTASEVDQFNNPVTSGTAIVWQCFNGTISATGLYTATTTGNGNNADDVYAYDNNNFNAFSNFVEVDVYNSAPTVATEVSATTSTGTDTATTTGTTSNLSVLGAWTSNPGTHNLGESNLTYTWAISGTQPGTVNFSVNGTNAAKNTVATFSKAGTYILYVTIAAPNGKTVQDPTPPTYLTITVAQTLTSVVVTPANKTLNLAQEQDYSAVANDQFGNPLTTQPTFTWTTTLGAINGSTGQYPATTPGTGTITAKTGSVMASTSVTVNDAAPVLSNLAITPSPVTSTSGALTVTGTYAGPGNLTYTWTEVSGPGTVTFSGGTTGLPGSQVTSTALFTAAGSYTVQVTATDSQGTVSAPLSITFTVNATFTALKCTPNPVTVPVGGTQQFTAVAYDQFGVALTSQPTITWSVVNSGGAVSTIGTAGLLTAGGVPGSAVVTASGTVGSLTYTDTSQVTIGDVTPTLGSITVNPNPVTGTTATFTVTGTYAGSGNLTYLWETVTAPTGGSVTFSGGTSGASGTAVTATGTFTKAGSYTVKVTVTDANGGTAVKTVTFTVSQTATTVTVSPSSASVGLSATQQFTALETDQFGDALATQPTFTWSVTSGGGTVSASGLYTAPGTPGTAVVKALASDGKSDTTTITITNTPPTVSQQAAANGTTVSYTTTASTVNLTVLGAYAGGESNLTYTWSYTGGTGVTFSANGTNAAKNITATFTNANTFTILVTITDPLGASVSSTVNVTINQALTSISVTPGPTDTEYIGSGTQTYTAVAKDQFGNPLGTQPTFTWSNTGVGSVNSGTGVYTIGTTPGTATIKAVSGSVSGTTAVTVSDVAPTEGTAASANPNPVTVGTTTALSVLGQYAGGEGSLTYTWAVTSGPTGVTFSANGTNAAKNTTATFTNIGTYTFTVTYTDPFGGSGTSSVVVTVKSAHFLITVTPNPATLAIAGTQTFTATTTDQFGNTLSSQVYTWSIPAGGGSLSATSGSSVTYTAPGTPGSATVEAVNHEATTDVPVTITDVNPTLGSITVSPSPVTGTTATFTVTGSYPGAGTLTYTWGTTGSPPAPVSFSGGTSGAPGSAVTATGTFTKHGTYTIIVTVTNASGATATKTVTVTVNQTATTISIQPTPVSVVDGTTQQFTASVSDQFGDPLTTQPTLTWSVSSGSGSINTSGLYTAPDTPGSSTVTVTAGSLSANAAVTNTDAPPTVATAASANPNPVTGTTTALSVLGAYVGGESTLTYTWTSASGPAAVTFSANGTNAAKSTTATFTQAGTYVLNVEIDDSYGGSINSQVTVTVNQTPSGITITPSPESLPIGGTVQFTASQVDQFGNPVSPASTFTWSVTSGGGTVDASGNYTAPLTPGTATVKAVSSGGGSASVTVTITDATPSVATPASATPNPVTGTTTNLSVLGSYIGGESTLTYTWAVTSGPSGVTFSVNGTNGSKNTTATFTQAGSYTFTVTIADASGTSTTSTVTVTVNQTLTTLNASPNHATINIGGTQQFTFVADDQFGNAMSPAPTVTWAVVVGTGSITSSGLFTATLTPGTTTVKVTSGSLSDTGTITISDTPVTVATAASATPNPVTGTTTNLSVLGAWNGGESNLTYAWTATGPASVGFAPNGSNAAKNAVATFTKAGSYTITCTITDGYGGSATSSVTVTVNTVQTTLTISPTSASITVGGTKQFTATASDQFGNPLGTQPTLTWTVTAGPGSVSSSGLYTASATAGTATVQVSGGGQTASAPVTVSDVAPTVATAAPATPNPVTAKTTTLSVLGAYAGGESNLTYTWSVTSGPSGVTFSANGTNAAKSTTATFTQAGNYTFTVTLSTPGGLTATSSVTVTVSQTATAFTVSPATATVVVNGSQQITGILTDQFGNQVNPQPTVTWTIMSGGGTVNTNGLFTAPNAAGTTVVKATSGTYSGTSTLTIVDGPPSIATPASATPNPVTGTTTNLSVLGSYIGGENTLTYTWSVTSGPSGVTFSVNGTNAAKNTTATFTQAGTYTFTVTLKTPSNYTTTNTVTVTVNQTPTSVTVTPNPASVGAGGTVQLTATSKDQFGAAISPSPTFTWSVTAGGGSVSSSGLYTAPGTTGTATVKATAGTASGTATINIIAAGTLNVTVSTSSAAVNLTTEGTLDWDHWGRAVPGLDQKSGGNLITGYTSIGNGTVGAYRTDKRPLSWTNGTPTASSTNNITGVYVAGQGNGFQIKSPAIGTTRTLVVYVGGNGAGGTLTASMSDGSVATYTNVQPTQTGVWDVEYTITYSTATAGATLNVQWVQSTSGNGSVTLSAATLH